MMIEGKMKKVRLIGAFDVVQINTGCRFRKYDGPGNQHFVETV